MNAIKTVAKSARTELFPEDLEDGENEFAWTETRLRAAGFGRHDVGPIVFAIKVPPIRT